MESNPSQKAEADHVHRRRSSRRKQKHHQEKSAATLYALAYPAPVHTDKALVGKHWHLRSRQFLQIQKIPQDTSHHYTPEIDVVSFAPPKDPIRLVAALKGLLGGKLSLRDGPGPLLRLNKDDVLLTRYHDPESNGPDQTPKGPSIMAPLEKMIDREITAVLRGDNRIVLDDGRLWTATNHQGRSFEFTTVDDKTGARSVARWVLSKKRLSSLEEDHPASFPPTGPPQVTFHFSPIRPDARRHAVLASLTESALRIKDTYHEPALSFGSPDDAQSAPRVVDEPTRGFIIASAVWLALTLGWSPAYTASVDDQRPQASWNCAHRSRTSKRIAW